ncbi:MAG TPA: PAS domain S-box protein [Anaerolineae bacterium]|nr:PAS domain S-box protein [Anaerolineae bacterium]
MEQIRAWVKPEIVIAAAGLFIIGLVMYTMSATQAAFERATALDQIALIQQSLLDDREQILWDSWATILLVLAMFVGLALIIIRNRRLAEAQNALLEQKIQDRTAQLAYERNLLRTVIDTVPGSVYSKDRQSRFTLVNRRVMQEFGVVSDEELIGKSDFDFSPRDVVQRYYEDEQRIIREGKPMVDYEEVTFDPVAKESRWVSVTKVPLHDVNHQIIGIVGVHHDITEAKRTAAALQASEEQYRRIVENAQEGIMTTNAENVITYINPRGAQIFGREPQELLGHAPSEFLVPSGQETAGKRLEARRQGQPTNGEVAIQKKDGTEVWLYSLAKPILNEANEYSGTLYMFTDITQRRAAEQALAYERDLLQALMDHIPDPIFFKDRQSRFVRSNAAHLRNLGAHDSSEILGKTDLDFHERAAAQSFIEDERRIIETGVPILNHIESNPAPDGSPRWFSTTKVAWRDARGNIIGTLGFAHDVTELKLKDAQLEASANLYRSLVEVMPQSMFRKDREGHFIFGNSRYWELLGRRPEEVLGKTDYDFFPKELADKYRRDDQSVMARGETVELVEEHVSAEGKPQVVRTIKSPVRDENGNVVGVQVMLWDITEGRRQSEQIRKLSRAVEQNPTSIIITDAEERIEYVNPAFTQVTGYTAAEILGKSPRILASGHTTPEEYEQVWKTLHSGQVWRGEFLNRKKNGELYWELASISPITNDEGKVTHFVSVQEDITEQKRKDEQLREREELLSRILDTVEDGIYIVDQNGKMTFANKATERITGATRQELEQLSYNEKKWQATTLDGRPFPEEEQPYIRILKTGQPVYDVEQCISRPDGSRVIVSINAAPLHDAEGKVIGEVASMTDVTTRKYAEQQLREREEQFRRLFEASPDAILLIDPHDPEVPWRILDCNDVTCRMNGYTREELIGQPVQILNALPHTPEGDAEYLERVRRAGVLHIEALHRHKDGHIFPIEISTTLITVGSRELVLGIDRDITERKRVENALRESERMLAKAQQIAHIGSWHWEPTQDRLEWSDEMFEIFGIAKSEFHNAAAGLGERLVHPEDRAKVAARTERALREGIMPPLEYRIIRPDGQVRTIWSEAEVIRDEAGNVTGLIGVAQDITARKRAEEKFKGLLESAPDALVIVDSSGKIRLVNSQTEKLFGYPREALYGQSVEMLIPPRFRGAHPDFRASYFRNVTARAMGAGLELFGLRRDGSEFPVDISLSPLNTEEGMLVTAAIRDVTERKRAERELKRQKELLQAVFDNIPVMIGVFDHAGRYTLINHAWREQLGYTLNEMNTHDIMAELYPDPDQRLEARSFMFAPTPGWRDFRTVVRSGYAIDTSWAYTPLSDGMTIAFGQDITKRKEVDRLKNEFISTVSHELRTPLTSIRGSLGLIAGGVAGPIPDRAKSMIDIAYKNSERLVRLINDILDIEKIESGKMVFNFKPIELMPLIDQAIEANRAYGAQYQVSFVITESVPGIRINADADRITQVLTNLLSNAAKFSPPGSEVEISVRRVAHGVHVAVHDHGNGIPDEFKNRIFQKFAQADSSDSRQKGGTGLGLSIVKAIVEKHDGTVAFDTIEGVGTTFYFEIPESQPVPTEAPVEPSKPRVLIVEDDRDVALLLNLMLKQGGFETDVAYDATRATELLKTHLYAAITLDLMLPDRDGISLIRELRSDEATRNLPIIVVSAKAEQGRQQLNGDAVWVADWLQKPIDQSQLVRAVQHATHRLRQGKPRILHVEDDKDVLRVVEAILQDTADVTAAQNVAEARELLEHNVYDLVILDPSLPDGSGTELLPLLRRNSGQIPVVIFSALEENHHSIHQVSAALVKSRTSNEQLLETISGLIRAQDPVRRPALPNR